jgi:hypothetical protein
MGLDPGMDHMSAVELIERAHALGGVVTSFTSNCGGLPSPEVHAMQVPSTAPPPPSPYRWRRLPPSPQACKCPQRRPLPSLSPQVASTTPFGYKFSWSPAGESPSRRPLPSLSLSWLPAGVIAATRNGARASACKCSPRRRALPSPHRCHRRDSQRRALS